MAVDIRIPQFSGTEKEQLSQIRSYLYQLAGQLQWALKNVDTSSTVIVQSLPKSLAPSETAGVKESEATFASIKSLIIKSAEIVDAYYDEINTRLEGLYVAQSDFGTFKQWTKQEIEQTSTSTTQRFENLQIIITGHGDDISSIEGNLQTIGQDLSYAQNNIVTINSNIEELDGYVAAVEGDVNALDTSLKTTKQELQSTVENTKNELSGSINSTKTELSSTINSTKEELAGNINNVKTNLEESLDTAKTELSGSIDSAKSKLTGDINTAKSELAGNINSTKEELTGSIDNAKSQLTSDINSAKEELSGSIDNAKSELTGRVNDVDSDLQDTKSEVNGRIDDTNGSVAGLGAGLNDANSRLAEVDKDLQDTKAVVTDSIQGVQDRVTGVNALLEDAKAQLNGSLDDLEAYVSGLKQTIIGVTAYLKSGLIDYTDVGIPVYGLEIGQSVRDEVAGTEVFNKYARFTSEKLSFFDSNGIEVAYISDKKLFIKMAEITVSLKIGGLISLVMPNGDVVEKWVGG